MGPRRRVRCPTDALCISWTVPASHPDCPYISDFSLFAPCEPSPTAVRAGGLSGTEGARGARPTSVGSSVEPCRRFRDMACAVSGFPCFWFRESSWRRFREPAVSVFILGRVFGFRLLVVLVSEWCRVPYPRAGKTRCLAGRADSASTHSPPYEPRNHAGAGKSHWLADDGVEHAAVRAGQGGRPWSSGVGVGQNQQTTGVREGAAQPKRDQKARVGGTGGEARGAAPDP